MEVRGKLVAQAVDLFSSREMQWVMAAPNAYLMDVGDGAVIAIRSDDLERWSVDYITRDRTVSSSSQSAHQLVVRGHDRALWLAGLEQVARARDGVPFSEVALFRELG